METSSSENSSQLFQLVDIHSLIPNYDSIKSFFSRYWSFQQSQHEQYGTSSCCSKMSSSRFEKSGNFVSPIKQVSSAGHEKKRDDERVYREDVLKLMGNMGLFCSQESEELNESFGSDELSRVFEEEPSLEEVKQAFDVFDVNKDGFIDAEELQRVLCVLGLKEGLKLDSCKKMIKTFDEDGRIDFHKFVKIMENSFC